MGTIATGSPRGYGPRASYVNSALISHVALEAMLQLLHKVDRRGKLTVKGLALVSLLCGTCTPEL